MRAVDVRVNAVTIQLSSSSSSAKVSGGRITA
jgi:hypothetical protein